MSKNKRAPWYSLLFGVVGIVGLGFSVAVFVYTRPVSQLTLVEVTRFPFPNQAARTPSGHLVETVSRFDSAEIAGLQKSSVAIRNTGNQIVANLPDESLFISYEEGAVVLSADVVEAPPYDSSFRAWPDREQVRVAFGRLKPKEQVTIEVFLSSQHDGSAPHLIGRSTAKLLSVGRAASAAQDYQPARWKAALAAFLSAAVTTAVGFLVQPWLVRLGRARATRGSGMKPGGTGLSAEREAKSSERASGGKA